MSLPDTIRTHRRAQGLTQHQLASAVDRCRTTITKYERGDITPPLAILRQMARIFHCSLRTLVVDDDEEDMPCATAPMAPDPCPKP